MSRHIWLNRTLEAARTAQVTMPWARSVKPVSAPVREAPAALEG